VIPKDASPDIQAAFREMDLRLSKLDGAGTNLDLRGRRIINAGKALDRADYMTREDVEGLLGGPVSGGAGTRFEDIWLRRVMPITGTGLSFFDLSNREYVGFTVSGTDAIIAAGGHDDYRGILTAKSRITGNDEAGLLNLEHENGDDQYVWGDQYDCLRTSTTDPADNDLAGDLILAAVEDVAASTGTITIKSGSANNGNTSGFLGIRSGAGTIYIPYLFDATP